jgi:hypothetical protein
MMDEITYQRCRQFLRDAESCMVEGVDGWHLARLSHVVKSLKEAYGPSLSSVVLSHSALQ